MEHLSYKKRLVRLGLLSLEQKAWGGGGSMIGVYKMRGMDKVSRKQCSPWARGSIMRGHSFRLKGRRFRGDQRNIFSQGGRNALPRDVGKLCNLQKSIWMST